MKRGHPDINTNIIYENCLLHYYIFYYIFTAFLLFLFHHRITQMQQQKENLTAQVNDTVAKQLALEEEAAGLNLALGNITSSLHQLALTDASPSPEPDQTHLNQTHPSNRTTEVSLESTCRVQMGFEALLCYIIDQ